MLQLQAGQLRQSVLGFPLDRHPKRQRVKARTSGGESNITAIVRGMGLRWESCLYSRQEMGIRDFRRMVKDWPHAGCAPDELAKFIRRTLNKT